MLPQLAQGEANKILVIPSEFTQALGGLSSALGNAINTEKPAPADGEIAAAKPPQPGQLGEGNGGR